MSVQTQFGCRYILEIRNYPMFSMVYGGQRGIRTLETVPRLHTFQACAFDHSATCPWGGSYTGVLRERKGGGLGKFQGHTAVLAAFVFDPPQCHAPDFAGACNMGAAAGLQINLALALPDTDQAHPALP